MKKNVLILMCLLLSLGETFAQVNLYTIKNVPKENIKPYIESALYSSNYAINKKDPYYALKADNSDDNITIILQKSGNDVLYYFNSTKDKRVNKNILKSFKNLSIDCIETDDENYLNIFNKQAQNIDSNITKVYNFDVWNNTQPAVAIDNTKDDDTTLKGRIIQIDKGTVIEAYLQTPINTASAQTGDSVSAVLTNDLVYNGYTIAQQGSILSGVLSKAHSAAYGSRNGRVVIDFNSLTTLDNKVYKLATEAIDFSVTNEGKLSNSTKNIATGAIIGALGGLLIGALSSDASIGKSILIGAGTGIASGAVKSVAEKGVDAEIPIYTNLEVKLTKPFKAVFY